MSLVTVARYRAITGDTASTDGAITARIELAEERLVDALDRPLAEDEYTEELLPTRDGMLWPKATPITACETHTIIDEIGLRGVFGPIWPDDTGRVEVTYTGGWVERTANPDATNRLPTCIEEDLAFVAQQLGTTPSPMAIPAGATSVRLGDAAVTFGPSGAPLSRSGVRWSPATLRYRYRVTRGSGC